ncbi:MAG: metallophosphoesterase family protein [Lachnospiraceae bacterium]|nr:metallophosphoesterase family protein [Lachnospiraceae bacterium]
MKFIHIADVHWGMNPDNDKPWSRDRAQAIKDTFAEVIRQAKQRDVDCLFIAGDLFHRQPLLRDLKEVNYLFSTIPSVRIIIIAGNHDRIRANSALMSFQWCPNVTWIMDEDLTSVYFEELNLEVLGFSYHTAEITESRLNGLHAPDTLHIHVLLAHGGDAAHLPLDKQQLAGAGFSYVALGHIHKPELAPDYSYAYPGSLEPLDKTETGQHGMIVGEISPTTAQITALEFVPMAQAQYISLAVHITPATTNGELCASITEEIQKRGTDHIYRFRIRGMRDPDIEFDLEALEKRLQIAEIIDDSEPQYDFSRLFAEHPSDMIGFYIRALQKEDASQVEKKALYYGIDALLRTTDERS